jgi:hypothetical protein
VDWVQGLYCDFCSIHGGPVMARTHRIEFECVVSMMHESSPWMLGEEEGLSGDLTGCSPGRQSNGCCQATRSGSSSDLSSTESDFMRKRNPKEGGEWMRRRIMRFRCLLEGGGGRGDGTVEEKRSTVSGGIQCFCFREKIERDNTCFRRGKELVRRLLVPTRMGHRRMQWRGGGRQPESDDDWIDPRWKTTNHTN